MNNFLPLNLSFVFFRINLFFAVVSIHFSSNKKQFLLNVLKGSEVKLKNLLDLIFSGHFLVIV